MLKLYLTKFRDDPNNFTLGISTLVVKCQNCDFDGDELNVSVLLDNNLAKEFESMAPWYSMPSAAKPYGITNLVSLLGPSNSMLSNYLYDKTTDPNEQDTVVSKMKFKEVNL